MATGGEIRIDFVCVENAGRSQMAAAFAERERERRGLTDIVDINAGGTAPADHLHEEVVQVMEEVDLDVSDRSPTYVVLEELKESDFLITMGCSISEFNPSSFGVESRAWELTNPAGKDVETVRTVRDEVETRVTDLFDEIEGMANERAANKSLSQRVSDTVESALPF